MTRKFEFAGVRDVVVERVVQFMNEEYKVNGKRGTRPRTTFQFFLDPDMVAEICLFSHRLQIDPLLELSIKMFAHHVEDVDGDLSEVFPADLVQAIQREAKAQQEKLKKLRNCK